MLALTLLFAAGPLDEIDAARAAKSSHTPTTIFVSFLGTTPDKVPDVSLAFHLALNSVSFRRKPITLTKALGTKTLYAIDYEDLEWKDDAVQRLLKKEPYFYPIAADVYLMRADWFVREATFGETYYDLMGFGKTLADLDKRLGFSRDTESVKRAMHGARVVKSGVAKHPRVVARLGNTAFGPYWQTDDLLKAENDNVFEDVNRLQYKNPDAHELFGSLPNGLFWWALANNKGELQAAAPVGIARDTRKQVTADKLKDVVAERPSEEPEIQNPHSCMGCHAMGLRDASDFVSKAITGGQLQLKTLDKKTRGKIEDFFDSGEQAKTMRMDSESYVAAVEKVTKKPAIEAGNTFAVVRWLYAESLVDAAQAAAELNVDAKTFEAALRAPDETRLSIANWLYGKGDAAGAQAVLGLTDEQYKAFLGGTPVPFGSNTLRHLNTGQPVPRDLWEKVVYREAALLVCYQTRMQAATVEDVRQKAKAAGSPKPPEKPPEKPAEKPPASILYDNVKADPTRRQRQENMQWSDGTTAPGEWDGQRWVKVTQ